MEEQGRARTTRGTGRLREQETEEAGEIGAISEFGAARMKELGPVARILAALHGGN
jgi:hypothetical protein